MITFDYFPASARASTVAIEMKAKKRSLVGDYLPPTVLIVGQYDQAETSVVENEPIQLFTADAFGQHFGFGSEIHRQAIWVFARLGGFSENIWGVAVPEPAAAVAATDDIVFSGTATKSGTLYFSLGGDVVALSIASGDTADDAGDALVAAITAAINLPVSATNVTKPTVVLTSKWKGATANEINIVSNPDGSSQESDNPEGLTVTVPGLLSSGAGDPDVSSVFYDASGNDKLADRWYTHITCPYVDTTALGQYESIANDRHKDDVHKDVSIFVGYVQKTYAQAYDIPATINVEWINPVWEPRSYAPNFELAAAVLGAAAAAFIQDPGRQYQTLEVGIPVDSSTPNLLYSQNNALFKAGMGYCQIDSAGKLRIGDLATSYRTNDAGAATEAWFDTVSIHRRQQKVYMVAGLLNGEPYVRGILGSDDQVTSKDYVVKPKTLVTDLMNMVDVWAAEGWTKNPDTVKDTIAAEINAGNNSRLDSTLTDDEAQALRIKPFKYAYLY